MRDHSAVSEGATTLTTVCRMLVRGAAWREGDFAFAFDADAADGVVWGRAEKFTFFGDLLNSERLAETANIWRTATKQRAKPKTLVLVFWRAQ